ncbi:MAG: hypothetical protein K0R06_2727 [Clostridium sp.]|jgi:hypothetical protein|nr:hypothetical protein [Clostridium sp.]
MENKGVRTFWYGIAVAFLWIGVFTEKTYIFSPIGWCLIIVGNIRSRRL